MVLKEPRQRPSSCGRVPGGGLKREGRLWEQSSEAIPNLSSQPLLPETVITRNDQNALARDEHAWNQKGPLNGVNRSKKPFQTRRRIDQGTQRVPATAAAAAAAVAAAAVQTGWGD